MTEKPSSYEKGLALELKLVELFKKMGYNVIHDAKRVGRSGVEHQIDILAEYRCPLHNSTVVVEAKSYDSPVDKDRIMKLTQIVDDLGADRGIIVTTSYFTPEAIKTSKGHNLELWNREQLAKFLGEIEVSSTEKGLPLEVSVKERVARFILNIQDAERIERSLLEKRGRGGFLGKGKIIETLRSVVLQYFPYYEVDVQATVNEIEKTGLMSTRTVQKIVAVRVGFDASSGDVIVVDGNGVATIYPFLKNLSEEEVKVFRLMRGKQRYNMHGIVGLGFSEGKAKKILSGLVAKGALESHRGERGTIIYQTRTTFPSDPRLLKSISDVLDTQEIPKTAEFTAPRIDASDVIKRIELYWNGKVNNIAVLYYPFYVCNLITEDGSQRIDIIDAISGRLKEL